MIDVIIPAYNAHKTIEYTLMSLTFQSISNLLNIVIVDDNSDNSYDDIIKKYKDLVSIKLVKNDKNMGAGYSRQVGIDNSEANYIIFVDSDDLIYSFESIEKMYDIINQGYDYLDSFSLNEENNNKYINEGDLHGKMYSRDFIEKNNIKFNNSRYHEDNAFNNIVLLYDPKRIRYNSITYIYCNNNESLTKKDKEKEFERMKIYIENMDYVMKNTSKCSLSLKKHYIINKYKYLSNYYKGLNDVNKKILNDWLKEYNFDIIN